MNLFYNTNAQSLVTKLKGIFNDAIGDSPVAGNNQEEVVAALAKTEGMWSADTIVSVLNFKTLQTLYVNDAFTRVLGLTKEDLNQNPSYQVQIFEPEQFLIIKEYASWLVQVQAVTPYEERVNQNIQIAGLKLKQANGQTRIIFKNVVPLALDANKYPLIVLRVWQNASHLFRGDGIWVRNSYNKNPKYTEIFHSGLEVKRIWVRNSYNKNPKYTEIFHSGLEVKLRGDIIRDREIEILRLISVGRESHEIAAALGISINTVNNHRKNMIDRVGVRDTTALLQVAQWCGIL
ncbi:MAG: LuxR C-terminal-related transcriptional regulator [Spirosomaceae bacterium]|nr:LuxR C-terminal-related transcriptional regulator [Spirosomataceae bacterium]